MGRRSGDWFLCSKRVWIRGAIGAVAVALVWYITECILPACTSQGEQQADAAATDQAGTKPSTSEDDEWLEIKSGDVCPAGAHFKMDFETGKNYMKKT